MICEAVNQKDCTQDMEYFKKFLKDVGYCKALYLPDVGKMTVSIIHKADIVTFYSSYPDIKIWANGQSTITIAHNCIAILHKLHWSLSYINIPCLMYEDFTRNLES